MAYPADYKYTKEHEWLKIDGSTGTIGITDYAQNSLGDIVFVELPKVGTEISAGKTFGSVESVKAVSDLFAPVTAPSSGSGSVPSSRWVATRNRRLHSSSRPAPVSALVPTTLTPACFSISAIRGLWADRGELVQLGDGQEDGQPLALAEEIHDILLLLLSRGARRPG